MNWSSINSKGFSLVEVTLALGVLAFAVIPVVGLMGVAMSTGREAAAEASTSLILSDLDARIASMSFQEFEDSVATQTPLVYYYNHDAHRVGNGNSSAHFKVTLNATRVTDLDTEESSRPNLFHIETLITWPEPSSANSLRTRLSKGRRL